MAIHSPRDLTHDDSIKYLFRVALVGLVSGILAVLFQLALTEAEKARLFLVHSVRPYHLLGALALAASGAIMGGLSGLLTARYAPEAAGSGIPHVKGVLLYIRTLNWRKLIPVKFVGGILSIGAGFSLGREGPTVQMGAASGKAVSDLLHLHGYERQLIAAGGGAGLAAAFNAPLAGVVFVIEELQREMSAVTYGAALVAAILADTVSRFILGQGSSFHAMRLHAPSLSMLPLFLLLGAVTGIGGTMFNRNLLSVLKKTHRMSTVSRRVIPAIIGAAVCTLTLWLPEVTGSGHRIAEELLRGYFNGIRYIPYLMVLFGVKYLLTMGSYASGVPGGIFAPLLSLGALLGSLIGHGFAPLVSYSNISPMLAVAGMAGMFASIVRAPLTGIILIVEMTANYGLLFPILVTCMMSYLIAERLANKPIYDALLEYDLERNGDVPENSFKTSISLTLTVEPNCVADGESLRDLPLPQGCLLVQITRSGFDIIPDGSTHLQAGDQVTAVVSGDSSRSFAVLNGLFKDS